MNNPINEQTLQRQDIPRAPAPQEVANLSTISTIMENNGSEFNDLLVRLGKYCDEIIGNYGGSLDDAEAALIQPNMIAKLDNSARLISKQLVELNKCVNILESTIS